MSAHPAALSKTAWHPLVSQREDIVSPDGKRFLIDNPVEALRAPFTLIQNWKP